MGALVRLGDGITGLAFVPPGSVGLVLSDLPSGETRAEFDHKPDLDHLQTVIWRALHPSGMCVLLAHSFRFAAEVVASCPDFFRYDLVWHKSLATGHLNAKSRPLRAHEFVLVFSREHGTYRPQMIQGASPIHANRRRADAVTSQNYGPVSKETAARAGATDRFPTSVLEFASVGTTSPERVHPQQKPVPLLRWLIETYSSPGDLVCDPYAGSGSTGIAAESCGRRFIGWDTSPRFGTSPWAVAENQAQNRAEVRHSSCLTDTSPSG